MDVQQIKEIVDNCLIPDTCENIRYHERNNFWMIEGDNYLYKIYKPIKNSEVDFSTEEKRCDALNKELVLNKRLASSIYDKLIAVKQVDQDQTMDDNEDGKIIDYGLVIKKVNPETSLEYFLNNEDVKLNHIENIAKKVSQFHSEARVIKNVFGVTAFQQELEKILNFEDEIVANYGKDNYEFIKEIIARSNKYLNQNRSFLNDRTILGFIRDVHGEITPGNIYFLDDEINITGCKNLNNANRHIDILNDIAALGMELDALRRSDLSTFFYEKYIQFSKTKDNTKTKELFNYYKAYRALESIAKNLKNGKNAELYFNVLHEYEFELVNN